MKIEDAVFQELSDLLLSSLDFYEEVYLVGGYIRDLLANRPSRDFDFVLKKNSIQAGRSIADHFKGDFYILDQKRQIARAIILNGLKEKTVVDCSLLDENGINADLRRRDFSINALALDINHPDQIIDYLGGIEDLEEKRLRFCSEISLELDPVRALRSVRFIQSFELQVSSETRDLIKLNSKRLVEISSERIRDEVFNIFALERIQDSISLLDDFGILEMIFPEISPLKTINPGSPHVHSVYEHTIRVVEIFGILVRSMIFENYQINEAILKKAEEVIFAFKPDLRTYFSRALTPGRSIFTLSHFAALYHDCAKGVLQAIERDGKISFPGHAETGAEIAGERGKELALSGVEIDFVQRMIRHHMKKEFQQDAENINLNLWLYRFFKKVKSAGVAVSLFHLADVLATYEGNLTDERWQSALEFTSQILDGWFNQYDIVVEPKKLISGDEIIERYKLSPGGVIGELVEFVRENQAAGNISSREDALTLLDRKMGC
ncbi:MAG: HD domain-containing protein [Chloroflexi bacterium]|nr:HD domain-containing protein [Chloroflexota bacterium]